MSTKEDWSVHEAISVSFRAFSRRYGEDLLWSAFGMLTRDRRKALREHACLEQDINSFIKYPISSEGRALREFMAKAKDDEYGLLMLRHMGIRWWLARDDLLSLPPQTRVPRVYSEGFTNHVSLQLLDQMLWRGAAPDTTCN
ncbi:MULTISPECIES: hypothetical protein [Klebsiella]|uniref:hypothetical protein n=1 Tax=Klebsiella TaxID=570 RepID=UPI001158C7EA|nr:MULTISPECIES: hypothetical protein [Klebsiella]ELT9702299.1 hypothetical protein [Klebsiella michiganensis]EJY1763166.1 hypothetical protein [Klebsiella oxytoca]MCW9446408.1 hypothetical protein [Klebsiella oxytoca]MDU4365682.1 hypothetical protein [Klebsiella oxytoca]MDZ7496240.1 hypothetical protein [Klebsiella oxytoca]